MKQDSTNPERKPLTPSDYLAFNHMLSRIRAFEDAARAHFMEGESDRSKFSIDLGNEIDRIHWSIPGLSEGRCKPPIGCWDGHSCQECGMLSQHNWFVNLIANSGQ